MAAPKDRAREITVSARQISDLIKIGETARATSRARDYWDGILDALRWVTGEDSSAIEAWLLVGDRRAQP